MQQSKRARALSYSAAVLLGGLVALGGDARADGFSQFFGGKSAGTSNAIRLFNPTPFEMIALWIEFDETTGNFDTCTGVVIPPFATDDDEFSSGTGGMGVVIAVPTSAEGDDAGLVKDKFGLIPRARKRQSLVALDPAKFRLHPDENEAAAELAACCSEINDEGEDEKIFRKFKMKCPEFGE